MARFNGIVEKGEKLRAQPIPDWRRRFRKGNLPFTEGAKMMFLASLSAHGLRNRACIVAGISDGTFRRALEKDPEFAEAVADALEQYRDLVAQAVFERGVRGWQEPVYQKGARVMEPITDDNGIVQYGPDGRLLMMPASIRKYDSALLQMEAKRVDPAYRDKHIDINTGGGGVLVAPSGESSVDEWIARQEEKAAATEAPIIEHE